MAIEHILFDADGVLQYPREHWHTALKSVLHLENDAQATAVLNDIFEAETDTLESRTGFVEKLEAVLSKWQRPAQVFETLNVLHAIEIHVDIMECVQDLRRSGFHCYIASNQQALRAKHMSEVLNYKSLFDSEFYSCFLGAAKPRLEFFEKTLGALGCHANKVLFLDDRVENVQAARRAGLNAMVFLGADSTPALRCQLASFNICAAS